METLSEYALNELGKIQSELKAPKTQFNKFGGYAYRSCEDILEALKGVLVKYECYITLRDDIVEVGGRVYVKATATIYNNKGTHLSVSAFAREADTKKGMDEAQITGSASSYARKYALNGLFAIDDTKDADATNTHDKQEPTKSQARAKQEPNLAKKPMSEAELIEISELIELTETDTLKMLDYFKASDVRELDYKIVRDMLMKKLQNKGA